MQCYKCGLSGFQADGGRQPHFLPCSRIIHKKCMVPLHHDVYRCILSPGSSVSGCGLDHPMKSIIPFFNMSNTYTISLSEALAEETDLQCQVNEAKARIQAYHKFNDDPAAHLEPGTWNPGASCANCESYTHKPQECTIAAILRGHTMYSSREDNKVLATSMGLSYDRIICDVINKLQRYLTGYTPVWTRNLWNASLSLWFFPETFCCHCGSSYCQNACGKTGSSFAGFKAHWDLHIEPRRAEITALLGDTRDDEN